MHFIEFCVNIFVFFYVHLKIKQKLCLEYEDQNDLTLIKTCIKKNFNRMKKNWKAKQEIWEQNIQIQRK